MDWLSELPTPLMIGTIVIVEAGIIALVLFILQKIGVNVTGGLPKTAWLQGVKNAFFTMLLMGAIIGGIAIIPIFGFGQSIKNGFIISFGIIWAAIYVWFLFTWISREKNRDECYFMLFLSQIDGYSSCSALFLYSQVSVISWISFGKTQNILGLFQSLLAFLLEHIS